jgi:hypothetical protein
MSYTGKVQNGVVVLPPEAHLPEGTEVEVRFSEAAPNGSTFAERFKEFIGIADDLPPDLARNLDHYVHGHPKK